MYYKFHKKNLKKKQLRNWPKKTTICELLRNLPLDSLSGGQDSFHDDLDSCINVCIFCPVMYTFCLGGYGLFIKLITFIFGLRGNFRLKIN